MCFVLLSSDFLYISNNANFFANLVSEFIKILYERSFIFWPFSVFSEFSFSSFSSFCCSSIGLLQRHGIDLPEVLWNKKKILKLGFTIFSEIWSWNQGRLRIYAVFITLVRWMRTGSITMGYSDHKGKKYYQQWQGETYKF